MLIRAAAGCRDRLLNMLSISSEGARGVLAMASFESFPL